MTKKQLIDDVILKVTKGAPSDDLELEPRQIAFWFDTIGRTVVTQFLNKRVRENSLLSINPSFITIEDNKNGIVENVTMLSDCDDRVYITLTKEPIELDSDSGVIRVITDTGTPINKVSIEKLDTINKLTFGRPTMENMLYTRVGQRLYIHGLNPKHISLAQFSVTYVPKLDVLNADDSDEVRLPDEMLDQITEAVADKARAELYGSVEDMENDAEQDIN